MTIADPYNHCKNLKNIEHNIMVYKYLFKFQISYILNKCIIEEKFG